jgi:hypothetical protein
MRMMEISLLSLLISINGCSAESTQVEAQRARSTAGIEEGSLAAAGVLKVANEASEVVLDDEVGLSSATVVAIVANRPFEALAELDAVPEVGPSTFEKLLTYAVEHGFVAKPDLLIADKLLGVEIPFDAHCTGAKVHEFHGSFDESHTTPFDEDLTGWLLVTRNLAGDYFVEASVGFEVVVDPFTPPPIACTVDQEGNCTQKEIFMSGYATIDVSSYLTAMGYTIELVSDYYFEHSAYIDSWSYECIGAVDFDDL